MNQALFAIGDVSVSPAASEALKTANVSCEEYVSRHVSGEWVALPDQIRLSNEIAIEQGEGVIFQSICSGKGCHFMGGN